MTTNENIERFERLLRSTNRDGIENLISFIQKSDFYTAPASTRFHSCHEGGLLEHSLYVYDRFVAKFNDDLWAEKVNVSKDGLIIIALLHDLCKCYFYGTELKNKKVYSDMGKKSDSNGRYDWVTAPAYTVDDKFPMGHGEKSMYLAERFIRLNKTEAMAIRWHMLWTEPKELYNTIGNAIKLYPIILALHEADMEATYLLEKEE